MRREKGITLISVVITIIIMLILAGITIGVINKNIIINAREASNNYKVAIIKEKNVLNDIIYKYSEQIPGTNVISHLEGNNIRGTISPSTWTNGDVLIDLEKIARPSDTADVQNFQLLVGTNTNIDEYEEKTQVVVEENNTTIYAVLFDGNKYTDAFVFDIQNIDKDAPTENALETTANSTKKFTMKVTTNDSLSGLGKIVWYTKLSTDDEWNTSETVYSTLNGADAGEVGKVVKTKEYDNSVTGTYNTYAEVYDVAGNMVRVPETGTNDVTLESPTAVLIANNTNWTNENVTLTASATAGVDIYYGTTIQELTDNYNNKTNPLNNGDTIAVTENETVYYIGTDGVNETHSIINSGVKDIKNIDKVGPTSNNLTTTKNSTKKFTMNVATTNAGSGLAKIEWYYKLSSADAYTKETSNYATIHGTTSGDTSATTKTLAFDNKGSGTYNTYAVVYDVAGNSVRVPETGTIDVVLDTPTAALAASPTGWTNGDVTISASASAGTTIYYGTSASSMTSTITNEQTFTVSENKAIYYYGTDGTNNAIIQGNGVVDIQNIDKLEPTTTAPSATATKVANNNMKITVTCNQADQNATETNGKSEIATREYRLLNSAGTAEVSTWQSSNEFTGLSANTTYRAQTRVKDNAMNNTGTAAVESTTTEVTTPKNQFSVVIRKGANVTSFTVAINGGSATSYTSDYSATLDEGTSVTVAGTAATGYSISSGTGTFTVNSAVDKTVSVTGNKIKITLNPNGGSGGTSEFWYYYGTSTFYSNQACTTTLSAITKPTRSGYTYVHYYGDGTSGGNNGERYVEYDSTHFAGDLATDIYKDATLYASWSANTYYVTYNANGGSGAPAKQSFVFNSGAKISTTKPTKTGCTFVNWKYGNSTFNPGDAIPSGWGSFELTAQWSTNNYSTTFNLNGGSSGGGTKTTAYGGSNTMPNASRNADATYTYTFAGWYTAASGGSKVGGNGSSYTQGASNVTYYAHWTATTRSYTVTVTKGTGVASVSGAGTYKVGASVTVNCTLNSNYTESSYTTSGSSRWKVTHTYSFVNWTGTKSSTSQKFTFTMPASNVSLTANGKDTTGKTGQQTYDYPNPVRMYFERWNTAHTELKESGYFDLTLNSTVTDGSNKWTYQSSDRKIQFKTTGYTGTTRDWYITVNNYYSSGGTLLGYFTVNKNGTYTTQNAVPKVWK